MTVNRAKHNMLNNEMIKMRKDIKNVAVRFVRKLNRDANKYLNRKNGSDKDKEKFKRRALRMKDKANVYKRLNADEVFKTIINSNWKQIGGIDPITMEVFDKISSDSKIQQKLKIIRLEVENFTEIHDKNSACLETEQQSENLISGAPEENENSSDEPRLSDETKETNEDKITNETNEVQTTEPADDSDQDESDGEEGFSEEENSEENEFDEEESDSGSSDESVDMDFNEMISKSKNIGDVLKNVGSKYDDGEMKINQVSQELSDELSDESSGEDDDGGDGFFTNASLEKFAKKTISEQARAEKNPSKTKKQPAKKVQQTGKVKSLKVEKKQKDVPINNGKVTKKKKNRLGQRERKKLYAQMNPEIKNTTKKPFKKGGKQPKKQESRPAAQQVQAEGDVHGSWQASQQMKKQLAIKKFEGTRITFSDSD